MRFDVLTLFPEYFTPFVSSGVARRAFDSGRLELCCWNPRDYAPGNYRRVDDRPFGGGPGMVMQAQPLSDALLAAQTARGRAARVVFFTPAGQTMNQGLIQRWAQSEGAVLVCGRYEGLDQRFIDRYVDEQISLGDFVLSGGEIAALSFLDAVARLQPGVLGDEQSHIQDSFNPGLDGLLDCPHYTRPEQWQGVRAPDVLMSGNHAQIQRWRREQRLAETMRIRPDLIGLARARGALSREDEDFLRRLKRADADLL